MPFQPAPNIAQVQVLGRQDGQLTINNTAWEITGGGITDVNLLALATAVGSWAVTDYAINLSEDWSLIGIRAFDLGNQFGAGVEVGNTAVGGVSGEAAPNNVAACVSFGTGLRGRSFRGRNYVPGVPNSVITLNTLSPTFISNIIGAYTSLIGPGTFTPGWQWVVLSREIGGLARDTAIGSPVLSVTFKTPYVRSMRTREVGVGA